MSTLVSAPAATASLTSFSQLFGRKIGEHIIRQIEIPLIQRDYAQGRKTETVNRIRAEFIDTLCNALLPNQAAVDLDFVFGDVVDKGGESQGKFYPLDGQQRLTTLFLLHCYLAWRTNVTPRDQPWSKFSYATRPGTRDFCDFLVRCQPDFTGSLSAWIEDQADYLPTWRYDPSIQSMLVVLDAFQDWFAERAPDLRLAWARLVNEEEPAIRFHLLPMKANNLTDELYIKMNSRGKPLTLFETFKAHFEEVLKSAHPHEEKSFARKVDKDWSDILWPYRGDDHLIDDEFMRYFRFIMQVSAWRSGIDVDDDVRDDDLVAKVYGTGAPSAADNLAFLFCAWDAWKGKDIAAEFGSMFTRQPADASTPLLMFNAFEKEGVDLFHACCRHYGSRQWTLAHTLLLYGVLLKYIHQVPEADFQKRLRILRNLVEASGDEIRTGERNNMPRLLAEVQHVIVDGDLQSVSTFNQAQAGNERAKSALLRAIPTLAADLHRLEDHELLRGGLAVFDLDPTHLPQRARAFTTLFNKSAYPEGTPWKLITAALLAKGDYSRQEGRWTGHRLAELGAPLRNEPWQTLFRGKKGEVVHPASGPLTALLDAVASGSTLQAVIDLYLNAPGTRKDWRYYFVKYDAMREGASGRYTLSKSGYQACMLEKERLSSDYYDPYLLAATRLCAIPPDRIANPKWPRCFTGNETVKRKLILMGSGLQIECVDRGWQVSEIPSDVVQKAAFERLRADLGIDEDLLCPVPQINEVDTTDRVELGAKLLAGLLMMQP